MRRTRPNPILIENNYAYVELDGNVYSKIDLENVSLIGSYIWNNNYGYPFCTKLKLRMHQLIMGKPPQGLVIDHIDRDPLNNTKSNLRFANRSTNALNSTRSDNGGVDFVRKSRKWRARVGQKHIGVFYTREEAYRAIDLFVINNP